MSESDDENAAMTRRLYATTDAMVWAEEWVSVANTIVARGNWTDLLDAGWMVGWFANAMQIAEVAGARKASGFRDVGDFHRKFGLPTSDGPIDAGPREVSVELYEFRRDFLQEELDEFKEAWDAGDHAKMADALIDLVYVAFGTAHLFGYPWQILWDEVQRANMTKARATTSTMGPRHNADFDVVKPPGWVPPNVDGILRDFGWNC